ncbi:Fe2+ transport system protein FeoA [Abditibacterium utsteinense]|uniref:Fe2+ transport system protein FeoA n=1 Tax=Abditibacterium utsteinense TaxID=1960156 RepID=A0A2S8SX86_9BACT|nr:FeoA family protein [Abditibacterium utsteinense]PQV65413.1 Fe2+ transport system protein FeoA [Abditibacterium utsteinense]
MIFRSRRAAKALAHHEHEIGCTSLCCAKSGQSLCVTRLCGGANECAKLRELGVREGALVTVLQHGTPILIRIDGARFGIGQSAAENVLCDVIG